MVMVNLGVHHISSLLRKDTTSQEDVDSDQNGIEADQAVKLELRESALMSSGNRCRHRHPL